MDKRFNKISFRILAILLVSVVLLASVPIFTGLNPSGATVEYGYIKGGSFETTEFWLEGRINSESAFDGEYVIKGNSDSGFVFSKDLELENKVTYTFNFWYRNPVASSNDKLRVLYKNTKNGKYVTIKTLELEETDEWKFCTLDFSQQTYDTFRFGLQGTDVEIDAVSIPLVKNSSSKNVIKNGSFETGEKAWNILGEKDITIKGNATDGFVSATLPNGIGSGIYFDFYTQKEVDYKVSFKYKGGGADASWGVARVRDQVNEKDIIGEKHTLESSSEWKTVTATFSSMLRSEHRLVIWSGNSGEITIDAVCVSLDDTNNLIENSGFEDDFDGWQKSSGSHAIVTNPVNSGEKALQQPKTSNSIIWQAVDVEPNTFYQVSFAYTFLTNSADTTKLKWSVSDASNDSQSSYTPTVAAVASGNGVVAFNNITISDTDWNNVILTVNSGSFTRLAIAFQTANATNPVYFDDVIIKKATVSGKVESILKNPGFEDGIQGWETSANVFSRGTVTNSGTGSLLLPDADYYPKISQTFAVEKGEAYVAMFSSYGTNRSCKWAISKAFDAEGNPIKIVDSNREGFIIGDLIGESDTWKTVISDVFVPEEDDTYRITFQAHGCTAKSSFIDDVIIVKADKAMLLNGDFSLSDIGWTYDSDSFEISSENHGEVGYSMNALSGAHKTLSQNFKVEKNTNYEVSFYYKGDFSDEISAYCISKDASFDFESIIEKGKLESKNEWTKHSFVINSGDNNTLSVVFQTMPDSQYFIDDVNVSLTDKVAQASQTLTRPYFVGFTNKIGYPAYDYSKGMYITEDENNLIADGGFEDGKNFNGKGTEILSDSTAYEGDSYLHFEAQDSENIAYVTIPVEKNTKYYATLFVRYHEIDGSNIGKSHVSFGFADPETDDFILSENPEAEASRLYTKTRQAVPVTPDNEWHMLCFNILSNDAEQLKFIIRGTNDSVDIDNIYIFKEADAIAHVSDFHKIEDVTVTDKEPELLGTKKDEDNLLNEDFNFESESDFWSVTDSTLLGTDTNKGDLNKVNSFHSIQKNSLYYESTSQYPRQIYYIRWIDVEPNTEYTFSAKCAITETGNGSVGIISGYRSDVYSGVTENMLLPTVIKKFSFTEENFIESCDWQNFGVSFNTEDRNRVGIMVYDGGGSAYVDDMRLFKTTDAAKLEVVVDNFPKNLVDNNKKHTISGGILSGVEEKTTIEDLIKDFDNSQYIRVFSADGSEIKDYSMFVGTGIQIRLMDGPVIKDRANVAISGDVTGDGLVDNEDSTAILKHISKVELLEGIYLQVADVDGDGKITVYDSMLKSEQAKTGKASFKLVGPKSFAVGDTIEVQLVCETNKIKALSGKLILPSKLSFVSSKSDTDMELYVFGEANEIYFAIKNDNKKEFKKDQVIATFEIHVGNISKYSEAEILLSDVFATTGNDLLAADDYKWTNVVLIDGKIDGDTNSTPNVNTESNTTSSNKGSNSDKEDLSLISTRLSLLKLEETEISPEFDPEIKEYTATVPFEIDNVTVTAIAEDSTAVVTVGDTKLEYVGNNVVKVMVETPNGGRRTYKIVVTREAPTASAPSDGLQLWLIILICCGGAILLAGGTVLTVILVKHKRKKQA